MVKNYELYFIINPELAAEKADKQVEKVESILKKEIKAEDIKITKEGVKKMSYPIKKHMSGLYVLVDFNVAYDDVKNMSSVEKKLNLEDNVMRYIIVDKTEFLVQKSKESLAKDPEFTEHRELNKGKGEDKQCLSKYLGKRVVDYKDCEYLKQFMSPYAKMFSRQRTGSSAKFQRKINTAIKRARHMALLPFTNKHLDN